MRQNVLRFYLCDLIDFSAHCCFHSLQHASLSSFDPRLKRLCKPSSSFHQLVSAAC